MNDPISAIEQLIAATERLESMGASTPVRTAQMRDLAARARAELVGPVQVRQMPNGRYLTGECVALGCLDIQTRHGAVHAHEAPGITTMIIERNSAPPSIGLMCYCPEENTGYIHQLSPSAALHISGSLADLARQMNPKATN